jgi:hypothetical protein
VSRYGRSFPHQPILPKLDAFQSAAIAPFQSTVILAGSKGGVTGKQRHTQPAKCGPYFNLIERPGVPTPNYTGTVTLAQRKGIAPRVASRLVFAAPIVGAAPPGVSIPRYLGTFVRAVPGRKPDVRQRMRVARFRFTPAGGFVGAKLGFLTLQPTRSAVNFTVQPTREGSLLAQ